MDPEIAETGDAGAGPAPETPAWAHDALDALIGDDYSDVSDESPEGGPADTTAPEPDGDDTDTTEPGDPSTEPETSDGDEPEELKEILKGLSRSQKGKVLGHYRSQAEQTLKAAQDVESRTRADADAREARAAEIREKRGSFIGEVEVKLEDGTTIPTYKEIERLLKSPGGDDILDDKYGMSIREAQDQLRAWDERKAMLDGSIDDFRTEAWVESGKKLAVSVAASGLPIDAIWKDVKGIDDVVPSVVAHLTAKHAAEVTALKKDYDGRLKAANANAPAVAARTAARTMPTPETGGRGDASGPRVYRESELNDVAFVRANEADIDRAYDEGRIVPG